MNELDTDDPLLPLAQSVEGSNIDLEDTDIVLPTSQGQPGSLRANSAPNEDYSAMSPIPEDLSPSFSLLGEQGQFTVRVMPFYEEDGVGRDGAGPMVSAHSMMAEEDHLPKQDVLHKFRSVSFDKRLYL